jgi:hypothetical protein
MSLDTMPTAPQAASPGSRIVKDVIEGFAVALLAVLCVRTIASAFSSEDVGPAGLPDAAKGAIIAGLGVAVLGGVLLIKSGDLLPPRPSPTTDQAPPHRFSLLAICGYTAASVALSTSVPFYVSPFVDVTQRASGIATICAAGYHGTSLGALSVALLVGAVVVLFRHDGRMGGMRFAFAGMAAALLGFVGVMLCSFAEWFS